MPSLTVNSQNLENNRSLLLEDLLGEQSSLSAVDTFSYWHKQAAFHQEIYRSLMPMSSPNAGEQYAFEVDLDTCSGCKACVVACHNLNDLEGSETWRKVGVITSGTTELPIVQHVTTACHHCVDPGCLLGCPVKAYEKDPSTGIVNHLDDQCFGCKYCTMMCPYEVPQYSKKLGIVRKCDMCSQRISSGTAPACVQACPNTAIRITVVQQADFRIASAMTSVIATAPPSYLTSPTTKYTSKRHASLVSQDLTPTHGRLTVLQSLESSSDQLHEGHWPLVAMLTLSQASVGMWLVMSLSPLPPTNAIVTSLVATLLGIVGIHMALLHLGRPMLAFRAFLGWRTSWLSREAIVFGLFMASSSVASMTYVLPAFDIPLVNRFGLSAFTTFAIRVTSIVGVLGVYCSAMIYVATGRELWNKTRTIWDMGLTTIGLGALGIGSMNFASALWMCVAWSVSMAALLPKILDVATGMLPSVSASNCLFARSGRLIRKELPRHVLVIMALAVLSLLMACFGWNTISFGLSVLLHCLHRWVYFASVVYRRMPGAST